MHSFHHQSSGVNIHHNGDYSGEAKIMIPASIIDGKPLSGLVELDADGNLWVDVPCVALVAFSFAAAITKVINVIEDVGPDTD